MPVTRELVKKIYAERSEWAHKGDFGKLLVVGGSPLYTGAPIFNSLAAYRAGCDLVTILAPEKAAAAIKAYSPNIIALPIKGDFITKSNMKTILNEQKTSTAMVIGGGLGRDKKTLSAIGEILKKTGIPTVVDADALHAAQPGGKNFLLTPHANEFYVVSRKKVDNRMSTRTARSKELAKKLKSTVLLKGHVDVITDGSRLTTNDTGSPYMTKGGFGDTLAGICGALLARGIDSYNAACVAAYINGKAGELAAKKFGEGVMASDMINEIPNAIRS